MSAMVLRVATASDHGAIAMLMKASARVLGRAFYDERENASFERHVAILDEQLVADGTYFVAEVGSEMAACGGWSRRDKLFTGNEGLAGGARLLVPPNDAARVRAMFVGPTWARRGLGRMILAACEEAARREGFVHVELMATLPGVPLYHASGYVEQERLAVELPDGISLAGVRMHKRLA